MSFSLTTYHPFGKKHLAFEHSEKEGVSIILGIEVLQKNQELTITKNVIAHNFDEIATIYTNSKKANLIITDSNILTKKINTTGSHQELLSQAFPNLDIDDFYYQIAITNNASFVAICRKQYIDTLLHTYKKSNIQVSQINLGVLKTTVLGSYINTTELLSFNSSITFDNGEITSLLPNQKHSTENYTIDHTPIASTHIVPFASILDNFVDQHAITGNIEEANSILQQTYKETLFFKNTLQYGIGVLLLLLLINFFIFNSNYTSLQKLQEEQQIYTTQKETIKKQQQIIANKENIVQSIINTGFSKSAYYTDQLIQSLPTTATLTTFDYQPIAKTIRTDKPILIKENNIYIAGHSTDKQNFTTWLDQLEQLPFVKMVTTINYGIFKNAVSTFEIEITLLYDAEK